MKRFKILTTCHTGWVYEVEANSRAEAESKFWGGEYKNEHEDREWEGDSNEQIDDIVEIKTAKNPFKSGDKVRFRKDALQRVYTVHTIYTPTSVSLGLYGYPDTEQDNQVDVKDIKKVIRKKGGKR
jgi:hypothetical protein